MKSLYIFLLLSASLVAQTSHVPQPANAIPVKQLSGSPIPSTGGVLTGTTTLIGGSLLTAGYCAAGNATVQGAQVGHPVGVSASDGSLPDPKIILSAAVVSPNTVRVQICAVTPITPVAITYNVSTQ